MVILVREIGVTLLRFAVLRYGVIAASPGGKAKTFVQIIAIGLYILPLPDSLYWVKVGAMGLAVLLTVGTGIDYVAAGVACVRDGRRPATSTDRRRPARDDRTLARRGRRADRRAVADARRPRSPPAGSPSPPRNR